MGDASMSFGRLSDEFAEYYSGIASDGTKSAKSREAAMYLSTAETNLEEDDSYEECLKSIGEAVKIFKEAGDMTGTADALRVTIRAYLVQLDSLQEKTTKADKEEMKAVFDKADALAKEEAAFFQTKGEKRGEAAMLLCSAELNSDGQGGAKLEEAMESALAARDLVQGVGDAKLNAAISFALINIFQKKKDYAEALGAADQALKLYKAAGYKKGEAKSWHMLGFMRILTDDFTGGVQAAMEALDIYKSMGLQKLEAFEKFTIAQYYLMKSAPTQALSTAEEALTIFKELQYGTWAAQAYDQVIQCQLSLGNNKEALRLAEVALSECAESKNKRAEALALRTLSYVHVSSDNLKEALSVAEDGLNVCQGMQDKKWEAKMQNEVAQVYLRMKNFEEATKSVEEALTLAQIVDDKADEAVIMNTLAEVHLAQNDFKAAKETAIEQKALFQQTGDKTREASSLLTIAGCAAMDEQLEEAFDTIKEAQELFEEMGDKRGKAQAYNLLAELHESAGDLEEALVSAGEMRACLKATGDLVAEAMAAKLLAGLHIKRDNPAEAVKLAGEGQLLCKKAGDKKAQVNMFTLLADAQISLLSQNGQEALEKGRAKALKPAQEALSMARKLGDQGLLGSALYSIGTVHMMTGKIGDAMQAANEARSVFHKLTDKQSETLVVLLIAETQYAKGDNDKAKEKATEALEMAKLIGDAGSEMAANALLERLKPPPAPVQYMQYAPPPGAEGMPAPAAAAAPAAGDAPAASAAAVVKEAGLDPVIIQQTVMEAVKQVVGEGDVEVDSPLMDSGLDSLSALSFRQGLQQAVGVKLPSSLVFDYPTPRAVADRIVELSKDD